jgi:two-component sensor histidine kinase
MAQASRPGWRTTSSFLLAVGLALGLLLAGLGVGLYNESLARTQKVRDTTTQARILASSVTAALAFDDVGTARENVEALRSNPEVEAAGVFDLHGRLVAGFSRGGAPMSSSLVANGYALSGDHLVVTVPVTQGPARFGSVYLRTITEPLGRRLARYSGFALLLVMACMLAAFLGGANASLVQAQRRLTTEMEERQRAEEALRTVEAERNRAALRQSEQQLEFALQAGRLGSWEIDLATDRLVASKVFQENFGVSPQDRFETWQDLIAHIHPDDRERHQEAGALAIAQRTDFESECRTMAEDGVRWILLRGRALYGADGVPIRMAGVSLDVTENKRATERQQLLLDELNHRVKNTLATVQSIAFQTGRATAPTAFEGAFLARIDALARAHDLLTEVAWEGATLADVVDRTLAPYVAQGQGDRIRIAGPSVQLGPNAAVTLTMAFHELATNAAKYGSLSVGGGRVQVEWRLERMAESAIIDLEWRESGGPPVRTPTRRGFGVRLVERGLARELGGKVELLFEAEGLRCKMWLPISGKLRLAA